MYLYFVIPGVYNLVTGAWGAVVDRQDPLTGLPFTGTIGQGEFAFDPMALLSDPTSLIQQDDSLLGFTLAPAAVLPVAGLAYLLLFRNEITGFVNGIISKYTQFDKPSEISYINVIPNTISYHVKEI